MSVIPDYQISRGLQPRDRGCMSWRYTNTQSKTQKKHIQDCKAAQAHTVYLSRLIHKNMHTRARAHTTPTHNLWKKTHWQISFTDMRIGFKSGTLSISI